MSQVNERNYPRWRFHKTEVARIVHSETEDKGLGYGWEDSPAAFESTVVANEIEAKSETIESAEVASPEVDHSEKSEDELKEILLEKGFSKKELKGLSHEEMLQLTKG